MGAYTSIGGRQRNESCNAKELLLDNRRMKLLFDTISQYGRDECGLRTSRSRVALEAILMYTAKKVDLFFTLNFMPPNVDGNSISLLISACFYYAIKEGKDVSWCRHRATNKKLHDMSFEIFKKLMLSLFYFSHLFEIFTAADDHVSDQIIMLGEFKRAKDNVLSVPGIELKRDIPSDIWEREFVKMDAGVDENEGITFHEFCQYAVKEFTTPEEYFEQYKKMPWLARPSFPPLFDPLERYQKTVAKSKKSGDTNKPALNRTMSCPQILPPSSDNSDEADCDPERLLRRQTTLPISSQHERSTAESDQQNNNKEKLWGIQETEEDMEAAEEVKEDKYEETEKEKEEEKNEVEVEEEEEADFKAESEAPSTNQRNGEDYPHITSSEQEDSTSQQLEKPTVLHQQEDDDGQNENRIISPPATMSPDLFSEQQQEEEFLTPTEIIWKQFEFSNESILKNLFASGPSSFREGTPPLLNVDYTSKEFEARDVAMSDAKRGVKREEPPVLSMPTFNVAKVSIVSRVAMADDSADDSLRVDEEAVLRGLARAERDNMLAEGDDDGMTLRRPQSASSYTTSQHLSPARKKLLESSLKNHRPLSPLKPKVYHGRRTITNEKALRKRCHEYVRQHRLDLDCKNATRSDSPSDKSKLCSQTSTVASNKSPGTVRSRQGSSSSPSVISRTTIKFDFPSPRYDIGNGGRTFIPLDIYGRGSNGGSLTNSPLLGEQSTDCDGRRHRNSNEGIIDDELSRGSGATVTLPACMPDYLIRERDDNSPSLLFPRRHSGASTPCSLVGFDDERGAGRSHNDSACRREEVESEGQTTGTLLSLILPQLEHV